MSGPTTAFWGMTINNYDDTDLALVQQGYPDYIRQIVYTLEEGKKTGTPHIQAYVRLFRQQRMSYIRKLFPGATDFQPLQSDEYQLNAQRYAQKLDETARSPAVITNNPFPDPVNELVSVIEEAFSTPELNYWAHKRELWADGQPARDILLLWIKDVEFKRVRKSPRLAKFYVSPIYRKVKEEYLDALKAHVFDLQKSVDTHTHTHTDEKFSHEGGITTNAGQDGSLEDGSSHPGSEESWEDDEGDEDSEGSESEASDEGDDSGRSESDVESED